MNALDVFVASLFSVSVAGVGIAGATLGFVLGTLLGWWAGWHERDRAAWLALRAARIVQPRRETRRGHDGSWR